LKGASGLELRANCQGMVIRGENGRRAQKDEGVREYRKENSAMK
jgi:hypothetical protein